MILGFKPYLKKPIIDGVKIHTLREDEKNRWGRGCTIQMATGVRTEKYECFREEICTGVQGVEMELIKKSFDCYEWVVKVDGRKLGEMEIAQLSINDGFKSSQELKMFFFPQDSFGRYKKTEWKGKIIHWTDYRY